MTPHADVAVVGAGIVGLAHAWAAARRGLSVVLFERHPQARGASVRNFGMLWPIGQPKGELYSLALRSREAWLEVGASAGVWVNPCGSLHLAYEDDEWAVLREFAEQGHDCRLLSPRETIARSPAVVPERLKGSLWSATECCVDPRQAIARIPHFLSEKYGITLRFSTTVVAVESPRVVTAGGETWHADQVFVCSGSDFETLFPHAFADSGLRRCKLQMMRTGPQPDGWRIGPHLAGGLTLCHYASFRDCPSLSRLRDRVAATMPDYVRHGIHVMASQNQLGEVVIGDSHKYDEDISVDDKPQIDAWILDYLGRMVRLPDLTIRARWHGVYAKHPSLPIFTATPQPNVSVRVAPGGAGMTMSFGLAEAFWQAR